MSRFCSTGKRSFDSEELAREALIDVRARNNFPDDQGPNGIYGCEICGCYHLTSKSSDDSLINNTESQERIRRQKEANFWLNKLNKR
jgi:hypothetical protein